MNRPQSIRSRFLVPVIAVALVASCGVAWWSWRNGKRQATEQMITRYGRIKAAVQRSSFPLTEPVLTMLAELTSAEWVTVDTGGKVIHSTIPLDRRASETSVEFLSASQAKSERTKTVSVSGRSFFLFGFQRSSRPSGQVVNVAILFDEASVRNASTKAAIAPLVTGLSTIAMIVAVMLAVSSRLIKRLGRLEEQVGRVSAGDFQSELPVQRDDEIGRLSQAVNSMSSELRSLWDQVNRQQGAKLLHQIAGSMAHQLRNTLTGARMAIELHQGQCQQEPSTDIEVALRQLEIAEDYINRLTALGSGTQAEPEPALLKQCLNDVRKTHAPIAEHLKVNVEWEIDNAFQDCQVSDGPALNAAVSNLLINAMQVAENVWVSSSLDSTTCHLAIQDDGPGIDASVAENLFEPFVTTKPEGMGLGLTLVGRVAEQLGGSVNYVRRDSKTEFQLQFPITLINASANH